MTASALPQGRADISLASTPDELLTAEEVAVLLRVTPAWVYPQTRSNRIPHLRLGRYVRYRRQSLKDWMDQVELEPGSPPAPPASRGRVVRR